MRTVGFFLLLFPLTFCENRKSPSGLQINGLAKGMLPGTVLYLEDQLEKKIVDSAVVINERFKFSTEMDSGSHYVSVHTKNFSDYKFFWMDNETVVLQAERGRFRESKITGSATQQLLDALTAKQAPFQKAYDSLFVVKDHELTMEEQRAKQTRLKQLASRIAEEDIAYVRSNPGNLSSAYLLNLYKIQWGRKTTEELYNNLDDRNKRSSFGVSTASYLDSNKDPQVGEPFVDFVQENPSGQKIKVSDYKGKILLLEFWSSHCGPCLVTNPKLEVVYQQYRERGFEILSVALDSKKDEWVNAIRESGITWENVSDLRGDENEAALMYGVLAIPDNFLIGTDGRIIARNLTVDDLQSTLKTLLTQKGKV
jgi:peroxiredoxin